MHKQQLPLHCLYSEIYQCFQVATKYTLRIYLLLITGRFKSWPSEYISTQTEILNYVNHILQVSCD